MLDAHRLHVCRLHAFQMSMYMHAIQEQVTTIATTAISCLQATLFVGACLHFLPVVWFSIPGWVDGPQQVSSQRGLLFDGWRFKA